MLLKGPSDAPARHATLKDAIAWSWSLLGTDERIAVAQCSVFRGGFDRAAAEAVLDRPRPAPSAGQIVQLLEALRDRSLLVVEGDDAPRFDLLVGIRAFAEATPDEGEARDRARARHAEHFRAHGGPGDRENLRAAFEHHLATAPEKAQDVLLSLESIYLATGPVRELAHLAERALVGPREFEVLRTWGRALHYAGDLETAREVLGRALTAARSPAEEGTVLVDLGVLDHHGDVEAALKSYGRALDLHRKDKDHRGIGRALGNIGALHHDSGRWDEARKHYAEALAELAMTDDLGLRGRFLANLGVLESELGHRPAARECFEQALAATRDRRLEAITRGNLGVLEQDEDRLDLSRAHHARALEMLEEIGDPRSIVLAQARLAGVLALTGDLEDARARLARAVLGAQRLQDPVAEGVVSLAHGYAELADAARAWSRGHAAEARAHTERVEARIAHAKVDRSDDARAMVRHLSRVIAALSPVSTRPSLQVEPAARGFRAPDGTWHDLRRRQPLRRLLLELIERRGQAPGVAVTAERLIEAAWPGEQIRADAATNRLYVALATLRKQGLKDVILSAAEGYLIDPSLAVVWVESSGPLE